MYKNIDIGKRLEEFSKKFSSKAELARQLNVTPQTLTVYFNGSSIPGTKMLEKLESIGCDVSWLMFGEQNKQDLLIDNHKQEYKELLIENGTLRKEVAKLEKKIEKLETTLEVLLERSSRSERISSESPRAVRKETPRYDPSVFDDELMLQNKKRSVKK